MVAVILVGLLLFQPARATDDLTAITAALERNDIDQAEKAIDVLIKKSPERAEVHHLLGALRLAQGRTAEAETSLKKATELDPKLTVAYLALSDLYRSHQRGADALALLEKLPAPVSNDPRVLFRLGTLYAESGSYPAALSRLKAIPEKDAPPGYWEVLGRTHVSSGQFQEAERVYLRILKEEPTSVQTLRILSGIALKRGDTAAAWEYAAQARMQAPDSPEVLFEYAQVSLVHDLVAEAIGVVRTLLLTEPDNPQYLYTLGQALLRNVTYEQAPEYFARYVTLRPDDPRGHMMLGFALYGVQDYAKAKVHLEKAIQLDPNLAEAYYHLGMIAHKELRDDDAAELFRRVLGYGDRPQAHFGLGRVYARQRKFKEAAAEMEEAAKQLPDDPDLHFQLSRVYLQLGDRERSARELELYRRLKAESEEREARSRQNVYGDRLKQRQGNP